MSDAPEDGVSPAPKGERLAKEKPHASNAPSDKVRAKRSRDGTNPKRPRITVEIEGVIELAAEAPEAASGSLPHAIPEQGARTTTGRRVLKESCGVATAGEQGGSQRRLK